MVRIDVATTCRLADDHDSAVAEDRLNGLNSKSARLERPATMTTILHFKISFENTLIYGNLIITA